MDTILNVSNLTKDYGSTSGGFRAVDDISFTIDEGECDKALSSLTTLISGENFSVKDKRNLALIGIVGNGIKGKPLFVSRVFNALSHKHISVEMISQGASEIDLSLIVSGQQYETAIQAIHEEFFEKAITR